MRPFISYNRTRPSVGKSTECICFGAFIFIRFNCTSTTALLSHIFPATTETGFITQGEFFYSLLISVFVLCYQPKCQNCFHVIICKFFGRQGPSSGLKTDANFSATNSSDIITATVKLFKRLCKITKSDYHLRHICLSIRPPYGTTRLPLGGFS
jgi:hypothetical protein